MRVTKHQMEQMKMLKTISPIMVTARLVGDVVVRGLMCVIAWLLAPVLGAFTPHAMSQTLDKRPIETEAQRLQAVRTLIGQEKTRRLASSAGGNSEKEVARCERMLDDLLGNKGFKPIEPVAVLDFEYPLWSVDLDVSKTQRQENARIAAQRLGPTLTSGFQRCAASGRGDASKFFGFDSSAGAPPYRAYVLPKRVNPFPASKLVYWSEYMDETGSGRKGYSWVNLDICEHTNGTSDLGMAASRVKNDPQGQKAALTIYRGNLAVWDVWRGQSFVVEQIDSTHVVRSKSRTSCQWSTYPETPVNK